MNLTNLTDLFIALAVGAIVGGSGMFLLFRDKLKSRDDSALRRRIDILEQVAQHVGKVNYVFGKYASLVNEIGPRAERMSTRQQQELEELSQDLVSVYEEISVAESKLLLLGELKLEKALKLYTAKMAQFRKQVYPGRYQNGNDVAGLKQEVADMREQFYHHLSERYDQKSG